MNLRLPGQVFDDESGLHYNYYRDYDPELGRYTTPDLMRLAGEMNPYAYVANNPLTNVDPLGLYQSDIHYYMTFFLAMAAGVDYNDARIIALADQYVDSNPATRPTEPGVGIVVSPFINQQKLLDYHFTLSDANGKTIEKYNNADLTLPGRDPSPQLQNLLNYSSNAPTPCSRLQFFGEYLHSFQDTFAHRHKDNPPYDAEDEFGLGVGHGLSDFSEPDYTYDDPYSGDDPIVLSRIWKVRAARTLEMEEEVFNKLKAFGDSTKAKSWDEVKVVVERFNKIQENEEDKKDFEEKFKLLNDTLNQTGWEYKAINDDKSTRPIDLFGKDKYDVDQGKANRDKYLCDKDNKRLKQSDYAGAILPTTDCPTLK